MAQLKDIVEIEHNRKGNASISTIYLFPEGTFYRAYEWSAWLCCPPFGRICNPPETNISICNAKKNTEPCRQHYCYKNCTSALAWDLWLRHVE